jgi:hypothetical protein
VDVIFQCLIQYKAEMRRFGAVAVGILPLVVMRLHRILEVGLRVLDIFRNFGQIGQLQGSTIGFYDLHQVYPVEVKLVVFHRKLFGWKIKGLLDQINVSIHLPKWAKDVNKGAKIALLLTLTKVLTHKFLSEFLFKKNETFG